VLLFSCAVVLTIGSGPIVRAFTRDIGRFVNSISTTHAVSIRMRLRYWRQGGSKGASLVARLAVSAALLIPCCWHSRIQAGDFGSHVYNVWLRDQIRAGSLPGLAVVQPWTNFLFDDLLAASIHALGYGLGQRAAAGLVVLLLFWGAFRLIETLSGASAWGLTPLLAIFTYGSTFHAGFFNFLLGIALSLWAMSLLLKPERLTTALLALLLLVLAFTAHALPVACAVAILAYLYVTERMRRNLRLLMFVSALAGIVAARFFVTEEFRTLWRPTQILNAPGTDQAWVFGLPYFLIAFALLCVILPRFMRCGGVQDPVMQLIALSAAVVVLIPSGILLPWYDGGLEYISDRLSLLTGILVLAAVAKVRPRRWESAAMITLAATFFSLLCFDTARLNRVEDQVATAAHSVPRGSRVVLAARFLPGLDPSRHMIDRACIGWCFSYANYEPSTKQFRVRSLRPNPFVAHTYSESWHLQIGSPAVTEHQAPIYVIVSCGTSMCAKKLNAGDRLPAPQFQN
jgi:hypothetical protein